ncbi:MAG: alpha/beta fold hydrolase [Actinobacteria bacterium]|nr:alpha/beta fold hydrolase [Actinomycetota bacterium]MCB9388627.1 alpha/beta fold hydrolase [Acidimicrobiia bacterium]
MTTYLAPIHTTQLTLADGSEVRVGDTGPCSDAPPIVLLHGVGVSGPLNWLHVVGPLSEHTRVITVDHRGHGRGLKTPWFRLDQCADDVVAVLDALEVDRAILAGFSMGGPIAMLTWRKHPLRVSGLVLSATSHSFAGRAPAVLGTLFTPGWSIAARLSPKIVHRRIIAGLLSWLRPPLRQFAIDEIAAQDSGTVIQALGAIGRFDGSWIRSYQGPVSVVITERDQAVAPRRQTDLALLLPHARVFRTQSDHMDPITHPERFVSAFVDASCAVLYSRVDKDRTEQSSVED